MINRNDAFLKIDQERLETRVKRNPPDRVRFDGITTKKRKPPKEVYKTLSQSFHPPPRDLHVFLRRCRGLTRIRCLKSNATIAVIGRCMEVVIQLCYFFYLWEFSLAHLFQDSHYYNPLLTSSQWKCFPPRNVHIPDHTKMINMNLPPGVYVQIYYLVRLTISCFVGHNEHGMEVRDQDSVLRSVARRMAYTLAIAFPYQVAEPLIQCQEGLLYLLFLVNFVFALRWNRITEDLAFLESYLGPLYKLMCLMAYGMMIDWFLSFLWVIIPYWSCPGNENMSRCLEDDCHLRIFNESCVAMTWFTELKYTMPPIPIIDPHNDNIIIAYFAPLGTNVPLLLSELQVFTTMRTIGIGITTARSPPGFALSVFMIVFGYYLYNWKLYGVMQTFYMEKELRHAEYYSHQATVDQYCTANNVPARARFRMRRFLELKFLWDRDLFRDDAFAALTDDYKGRVLGVTALAALRKVRMFRGLPVNCLCAIALRLRTMLCIRGLTIKKPDDAAMGLMLIRRGIVVVIALEKFNRGSIVKLQKGDFFGDINLLFPYATPLLIVAATDVEIWYLSNEDFKTLSHTFTADVRRLLYFNQKAIMDASGCVFHEDHQIHSSRRLKSHLEDFLSGKKEAFPMHLCERAAEAHERKKIHKLNDQSRMFKTWSIVVAVIAALVLPVVLSYDYPSGWPDVIWPGNPVSAYWRCKYIMECSAWDWTQPFIIWLVSFLFLADLVIWLCMGIVTPYGIIRGRKAAKQKFTFIQLGSKSIAKFISVFWVGFKVLRLRDVLKSVLPWDANHYPYTVGMSLAVAVMCQYFCRFYVLSRFDDWDMGEFCHTFEKWWGHGPNATNQRIVEWCQRRFNRSDCIQGNNIFSFPQMRSWKTFEENKQQPHYIYLTRSLAELCKENVTLRPSVGHFLSSLYVFYDFATTQGSGNIKHFWALGNDLFHLLKLTVTIALIVAAAINAKLTARFTASYMTRNTFSVHEKRIKDAMKMRAVPSFICAHVGSFVESSFVVFNRVGVFGSHAAIMESIPFSIKTSRRQFQDFVRIKSFFLELDPGLRLLLFNRCQRLDYPPGCIISYNGCTDIQMLLIVKGFVTEVDGFGVQKVRGPGDVLGRVTLWYPRFFATGVSMTHVRVMIVDEPAIAEGLRGFRNFRCLTIGTYIKILPHLLAAVEEIDSKEQSGQQHEKIVASVLERTKHLNFDATYSKGRSFPRWQRIFFMRQTFYLTASQQNAAWYLAGGLVNFLSAFFALIQGVTLVSPTWLHIVIAILDALVIVELYFQCHQVFNRGERIISSPAAISKKVCCRDWMILLKIPLDLLFLPFRGVLDYHSFHVAFLRLRIFRGLRFFEVIRRSAAMKKLLKCHLAAFTCVDTLLRSFIHIHVMGLGWLYFNCRPLYWNESEFSLNKGRYPYCSSSTWEVRMFDRRETLQVKSSASGVFYVSLQDSKNAGSVFTDKIMACVLYKDCDKVRNDDFHRYLIISDPHRGLGEFIDEFSMTMTFLDLPEYYSLCIYWASQTLTVNGFGDISLSSKEELILFLVFFALSIIHGFYIVARLVGVYINLDTSEFEVFSQMTEACAYLESNGVPKHLVRRVRRFKEMHHAFHVDVLRDEKEVLPRSMYHHLKLQCYSPTLSAMLGSERCPNAELRLLSSLVKEIIVPQGDFIVRKGEVVDGVFIIADGSSLVVAEDFDADVVAKSVVDNANRDSHRVSHGAPLMDRTVRREYTLGELDVGTCLGISTGSGAVILGDADDDDADENFKLAIWESNVVAQYNCRILYLSNERMRHHRTELPTVLSILLRRVAETEAKVTQYMNKGTRRNTNVLTLNGSGKLRLSSYFREMSVGSIAVFHPTDSVLNVVIVTSNTAKSLAALYAISCGMYIGRKGASPDPTFPYHFKPPSGFVASYSTALAVGYACTLLEMGLKMRTGFILDGRAVMNVKKIREHYVKDRTMLTVDLLSLLPSPFIYLFGFDVFLTYASLAILLLLPQLLQLGQAIRFFTLPRQADPFSARVLKYKMAMKYLLIGVIVVNFVALAWLYVGCSELQHHCRHTWVEFAHKGYNIKSNLDMFFMSFYFSISLFSSTGYGDITGHVMGERFFLAVVMPICMVMVSISQAKITSRLYTIAARAKLYSTRISTLSSALEANEVPAPIIAQVSGYLKVKYGHQGGQHVQKMFADVHPSLRKQIHHLVARDFLNQLRCLDQLPLGVLQYLSLFITSRLYITDDVIFCAGDVVSAAHFLGHGEAVLTTTAAEEISMDGGTSDGCETKKNIVIGRVQSRCVAFESALLKPRKSAVTMRAASLAIVLTLEHQDLQRVVEGLVLGTRKRPRPARRKWTDLHQEMKNQYGEHRAFKNLAFDRTLYPMGSGADLFSSDEKCRQKMIADRSNEQHPGLRMVYERMDERKFRTV